MSERYRHLKRAGSHGTFLISCKSHSYSPFLLCSRGSDHSLASWNPTPSPFWPSPSRAHSAPHRLQRPALSVGEAMFPEPTGGLVPGDIHQGTFIYPRRAPSPPEVGWRQPPPHTHRQPWKTLRISGAMDPGSSPSPFRPAGTACNFPGSRFLQLKEETVGLKGLSEIFQADNEMIPLRSIFHIPLSSLSPNFLITFNHHSGLSYRSGRRIH